MAERHRVDNQHAFVLHTYPYSETSLIVEALARESGRVVMIAKGARRPRSALRGVLVAFQPVALSWSGRGEMRTLLRAEWIGGHPLLHGEQLLCGFYLNELMLRLLARDDPHERLFDHYEAVIERLSRRSPPGPSLRWFEKRLLEELGYAVAFDASARGEGIEAESLYTFHPESGAAPAPPAGTGLMVHGRTLIDLARDEYADPRTQQEAKLLMRFLINHRLEQAPMHTRQIFRDLQNI